VKRLSSTHKNNFAALLFLFFVDEEFNGLVLWLVFCVEWKD